MGRVGLAFSRLWLVLDGSKGLVLLALGRKEVSVVGLVTVVGTRLTECLMDSTNLRVVLLMHYWQFGQ